MKNSAYLAALVSLCLTAGCSAAPQNDSATQPPQTSVSSAEANPDFQHSSENTPLEETAADSSNVFVGTVIRKTGDEPVDYAPEEQFEVRVNENLKGELTGSVTVNVFPALHEQSEERNQTLKEGAVYVFFTRFLDEQGWYTVVPGDGRLTEVISPLGRNAPRSQDESPVQRARNAVENARPMRDSGGRVFPTATPNNSGADNRPAPETSTKSTSETPTTQTTN